MAECLFCAIAAGTSPSERIYEDEHAVAFMDIMPATEGHALVIPRAHAADLFEISEEDARHVMTATHRVAALVRRALSPDGMNVLQANGAIAFQSVFHLHMHVVPRYRGDGVRLPWKPGVPGDGAKIAELAARIRSAAG